MRCRICETNLGGREGWTVCSSCEAKYPHEAEAVKRGELVATQDEARIAFRAVRC